MPPQPPAGGGDQKTWAWLCHLSALSGFVGIPLGHILGPLIIWLIKKDTMPMVNEHGKEALNFQISMTIYGVVAALLILAFIGFVLLPVVVIADIVLVIIATVAASKGQPYKYPFTIRLIK
jgi:hypothetical protein